ncbi:HPP family protein [Streptosporangium sp. NPDC002544]|uniref:HPP family protein n=1 Tax=Streptosporangium sp. NPDC002544 TaxID=3154538 RepID=UPI00331C491C
MGVRNFFPAGRMRRWTTPFPPQASGPEEVLATARLDPQAVGDPKEISREERGHLKGPIEATPDPENRGEPSRPWRTAHVAYPVAFGKDDEKAIFVSPTSGKAGMSDEIIATDAWRGLRSRAPARPKMAAIAVFTAGATIALVTLVAFGTVLDQVWLIPPLVASAALVFGAPTLPLAQPRSVIGGQLLAALTGFAVLAVAGSSVWAAAVAGGLALGVTALTRTPHSPAAATATVVVAQQQPLVPFLPILVAATVVLVLVGMLIGRSGVTPRYPTYWW